MIRCVYILIISFFLTACGSTETFDEGTPEGLFNLGVKLRKDQRYEESLSYLSQIKNKFQYSKYAVAAELLIADIQYEREAWLEAENSYKLFKEFHPTHKKIDYVTFRLAMTYFKQLPDTIDRDLTLANKALLFFEETYGSHPKSDYAGSAKDHYNLVLKMLAKKELYIADFYFIRDMFDSALRRYEMMLKKFPMVGLNAKALYGAAVSAHKVNNREKTEKYFKELSDKHKSSDELEKAREEIGKG